MLFDLTERRFFFDPFSMHFFASPANPLPVITKQDASPAYASRLLHEVTHLDCMRTDLGVALLTGMLWLRNNLDGTAEDTPVRTSDGEPLLDPSTCRPMLLRPLLVRKVLHSFSEVAPVLEGLAMFAQLDLRLSSEEVSSVHFRTALSLLLQSGTGPKPASDIVGAVLRYHDEVREYTHRSDGLLHKLLFGVGRSNSYYLFGYIFIKSLVFILRQKDDRFRDSEMAYLFLRTYLLNGADYIDGVLSPGLVSGLMRARLATLLDASPEGIRIAYELIANDTNDKLSGVDWAHFLTAGELRAATKEASLREYLDGAGVEHDELAAFLCSMDFIPLKLVSSWIAGARQVDDHVQLSIVSGDAQRSAHTLKWVTLEGFQAIKAGADQTRRIVPIGDSTSILEPDLDAIGSPNRASILWTGTFMAEKLTPISLWSCHGAVFAEEGSTLSILAGTESAYLNFFHRRRFADFIFGVVGQQLVGAAISLWDFCQFIFHALTTLEGGRKLSRLIEHGFAIVPGIESSLSAEHELSADTCRALNKVLRFPIFE